MNINQWIKRPIAYTESWKHTLLIGCIIGGTLGAILIFLQPFDTYLHESPTKNLELLGYTLLILIVILVLHVFENWLFKVRKREWLLWQEVIAMLIGNLFLLVSCYVYNAKGINDAPIGFEDWLQWALYFGIPFMIFLLPFWVFLRARFGTKEHETASEVYIPVTITGQNKSEKLEINIQDFVYAKSQQNYADIFFRKNGSEQIEKKILRITLAQLKEQLPDAEQVHRSYVVNVHEIEKIEGNSRKRLLRLKNLEEPIPLSSKYHETIRKALSNSSQ